MHRRRRRSRRRDTRRRPGPALLIPILAVWALSGTAASAQAGSPAIPAPPLTGEPANALLAAEAATIDLFEAASRSVVCIRTFSRHVEKPAGAWNRMEVVCDGDTITNIVNGFVVNRGTGSSHTEGKIQFQSEGAEIFFRKIEVRPLRK